MSSRDKSKRVQCIGRVCGDTYYPIPGVSKFLRAREAQCERACAEGSNLCKICLKHEEKAMEGTEGVWHGRIGQPIPADSRIEGSAFALEQNLADAAREAKKATAVAHRKSVKAKPKVAENATGGVADTEMEEFLKAMRKYAIGRAASNEKAARRKTTRKATAATRRSSSSRTRRTTA